jgi:hypothetical protein
MQRIFTLVFSTLFFGLIAGQAFTQSCIQATTITNCQTSATEIFDNDATIGTSGFSGDFTLQQQGNDKFLETTFTGVAGLKSVVSPFYVAPPTNGIINFRFDLSGNAATSSTMEIFVNTLSGNIPDASGNIRLCTAQFAANGLNCFSFLTPAALANNSFRFVIRFTITGNNRVIQFDDFGTNVNESQTPLPVSFISFNAQKISSNTQLTWKVGEEDNVKGYEVERSIDGSKFTSVGFVPASGKTTYTFSDAQTTQGTVFYRIRNVDNDGKFKYSNILSLKNGQSSLILRAFPLPAVNKLTIQHEAAFNNGKINIASSDGSVVKRIIPSPGSLETVVNLSGLKSGIYVLYFDSGNGKMQTMKFMKQ